MEEISYLKTVDGIYQKSRYDYKIEEEDQQRYTFIIEVLVKIAKIYPLCLKSFLQALKQNYPYKKKSEESLFIY